MVGGETCLVFMGFMTGPWDQEIDSKREEHIRLVTHGDADVGLKVKEQVGVKHPSISRPCIFPILCSSKKQSSMKAIKFPGMGVSTF
jgi:hypothetical protein